MVNLSHLSELPVIAVWDGVRARRVEDDRITLAIVELDPNAVVPEHRHPAEQTGMVLRGQMTFRVADEERVLGPGGTWRIRSEVPHSATAGPDGAEVIDVFSPTRADWDDLEELGATAPRWPSAD